MIIAGTIRNSVGLAELDSKWQLKKNELSGGKKQEMTAEERERWHFQQQADDIREGRKPAEIDAKLQAGEKLTPEEMDYLKKNNPQALREYEEAQKEREGYKRQLKNCKSKEEVEELKTAKMGQFMAAAKSVANNPYIPKGKKCQLMKKILMEVFGTEKEHQEFLESSQYISLPDDEKEREKRRHSEGLPDADEETADGSDMRKGEVALDTADEIQRMIDEIAPPGSRIDAAVGGTVQSDSADMAEPAVSENGIDMQV